MCANEVILKIFIIKDEFYFLFLRKWVAPLFPIVFLISLLSFFFVGFDIVWNNFPPTNNFPRKKSENHKPYTQTCHVREEENLTSVKFWACAGYNNGGFVTVWRTRERERERERSSKKTELYFKLNSNTMH